MKVQNQFRLFFFRSFNGLSIPKLGLILALGILIFPFVLVAQTKTSWQELEVKGKPKEIRWRTGSGDYINDYTYQFNSAGNYTNTTANLRGKVHRSEYEYDKKGRLILHSYYENGVLTNKEAFTYDAKGNQISMNESDVEIIEAPPMQEGQKSEFKKKFDTYGNLTESALYLTVGSKAPELRQLEVFRYEYDKQNNWVVKERSIKFKITDEFRPGGIETRSFTYYR